MISFDNVIGVVFAGKRIFWIYDIWIKECCQLLLTGALAFYIYGKLYSKTYMDMQ